MTRTVFHGGKVFDGTMAPLADADVVIADGKIVEVGTGLDGDEGIDCAGKALLPGLFDTHVHLTGTYEDDELTIQHRPFSYGFYQTPANLLTTIRLGITSVRDAGGADAGSARRSGTACSSARGCRWRSRCSARPPGTTTTCSPAVASAPAGCPTRGSPRACVTASTAFGEGARGDPCRGRRDQDRVLGRLLLTGRRSEAPAFRAGRARHDRADGRGPGPLGHVARARARGHQARRARGRPLDRARHVPGPGVRRADGRARHLARADADGGRHYRGAGQRREARAGDPREVPGARPSGVRRDATGRRGRREGRDGHRRRRDAARLEPQRADAHGEQRVHARTGAARRRCRRPS